MNFWVHRKKTGDKFSYDTSHAVCWQNAVLLDGGHLKKMAEINFSSLLILLMLLLLFSFVSINSTSKGKTYETF